MLHTLLNLLLLVVALVSLGAIGFVAAGECSLRAKQRREAAWVDGKLPPIPRVCLHPHETLAAEYAYKVAFKCLDCGEIRIVGDIWLGATNKAKRGAA